MKKTITICSLILGVFCLGCSKDSTTAPTVERFTISIAESEKGIVDPHGDFTVQRADSMNIKAKNSREGYRFHKWQITNGSNNISVRDTAGDSTYVADIAGDAEIEAVFVKDTFDIVVTSDEHGNALVEDTFKVAYGEGLDITAGQSATGYRFSHWTHGAEPKFSIQNDKDSVTSITDVAGNGTVTCSFALLTHALIIEDPNPVAGGAIRGSVPGTYSHGDEISLVAEPNLGWKLKEWNGVGATGESISFNIYEDMTISAAFDTIGVPEGIICVRHDAPQNGPGLVGSNWVKAYKNLQDALEAAPEGAEVWVARGTYLGGTGGFVPKSKTRIHGSFTGNESTLDDRDEASWYENISVLDGDGQTDYLVDLYGKDSVVIDRFVLQKAIENCVYIDQPNNQITNCVLRNNNANGNNGKGAVLITASGHGTMIKNCVFRNNFGTGSSIINSAQDVYITNSLFVDNHGPAIIDDNSIRAKPTLITCCTIFGNKSPNDNSPGGLRNGGNVILRGSIVYGNTNNNGVGTQIDTTYIVDACCIEDTVGNTGVFKKDNSNNWYGNNTDIDPDFYSVSIYEDDGRWFASSENEGSFMPQAIHLLGRANFQQSQGKPNADLRNEGRPSTFDVGCYEMPLPAVANDDVGR